MDPTTLVVLFSFAWGAWILYRIHRRRTAARQDKADPPPKPLSDPDAERAMPRMGEPGTITFNQIKALQRNNFTPNRQWSREEAALILDAVAYLRAVCREIADDEDGPPPVEVQNELLRYILTTQDIRDHVRKWGDSRRAAGRDADDPADVGDLPRNDQHAQVADKARSFLVEAGENGA